jgi:hypothetical protein
MGASFVDQPLYKLAAKAAYASNVAEAKTLGHEHRAPTQRIRRSGDK